MTANERLEVLLNCVNSTINDIPNTYDEETRKTIGDALRKRTRSPYDEIAYLGNIIVRLEQALAFVLKETQPVEPGPEDGQMFVDEEMLDDSVYHGEPVEIDDDLAKQIWG